MKDHIIKMYVTLEGIVRDHIGKIIYAGEGIVISYVGKFNYWDDIKTIIVAGACASVTLFIQHFGKKFLAWLDRKMFPPKPQKDIDWRSRFRDN